MPMTGASFFLDPLWEAPDVRADFVTRVPGVGTSTDRDEIKKALRPWHERALNALGFSWAELRLAEQVHGADIAIVDEEVHQVEVSGVDGLITNVVGVCLGIYVADCGAVYVADRKTGALGLFHSGKKGSEGNITGHGIAAMTQAFQCDPADLIVSLAPCIRPPAYEVDFAAQILDQALAAGVLAENIHDSGLCTSQDLRSYYSYRMEKGDTGRMLALLGRK